MTKSAATATEANDDVSPSWSTWEELLLAFAVNRHGTGAWDSIAAELQKRTSESSSALTAQNCRFKYLDLRRRYVADTGDLDDAAVDDKSNDDYSVSLLEELRKLRVAELRREVQRYDLNIESLELKMNRMEEEREKVSRRDDESDLEKNEEKPESKPANGGETVTGDELEKDHLSVNESNSSDLGAEKLETGEKEAVPVQTGRMMAKPTEVRNEPDKKSVRTDSCNGSSNSIEKELNRKKKVEVANYSAESKGGGAELSKDNSDVQSSASRSSEEEEGRDKVQSGSTSGDEREHEDQSRGVNELSAESHRLIDFLKAIRSHKCGSVFERGLRTQESLKYQKLILQHVDLETIETRLKEGWYSGSKTKFFRDLLLIVNNALVFFNKNSSEATAATEVRILISKLMSQKSAKSDSSSRKQASLQSLSTPKKDEPQLKLPTCRPRSSIAAKADKKKEQIEHSGNKSEEPKITKKITRDHFSPAVLSNSKKNSKIQLKNNGNKSSVEIGKQVVSGGSSSHSDSTTENKKNQSIVDLKKRGGMNVKNNNGTLAEALKTAPLTTEKKIDNVKRWEKKEQVSKRGLETRQGKEKGSLEKKNVGRPPKREVAASPPLAAFGKRGRDRGEGESGGSKQQPKKRSRKL